MKIKIREQAKYLPDRMAKIALAVTSRAQLDLYCLAPGQAQKPHVHDDQDKIYVLLEGRARVTLADRRETLEPGEAVLAAAGVPHGVESDGAGPALLLVFVSPPPAHAG